MKRTIATIRQLITEVNTILPAAPLMSFRKKGMDRYILIFEGTTHDREFGPLSCGEACEFINGIIYARMETSKLLNKQTLYVSQLEDEVASAKPNGDLKAAEHLINSQKITIDNLKTENIVMSATLVGERTKYAKMVADYEKRIQQNANGLYNMYMEKEAVEKELSTALDNEVLLQDHISKMRRTIAPVIGLGLIDEMIGTKQVLECTSSTLGLEGNKYIIILADEYRKSLPL